MLHTVCTAITPPPSTLRCWIFSHEISAARFTTFAYNVGVWSDSELLWQSLTSHDRASSATAPRLPDADRRLCRTVNHEISRFPRKERLHMPGSLTTPGRPGLAMSRPDMLPSTFYTASAPRMRLLSRLNGWPVRSPVNASPWPSRATAHDSGPMWFGVRFSTNCRNVSGHRVSSLM